MPRIVRPLVRAYVAPHEEELVRHVRAGGHAVYWRSRRRATLVMPPPDENDTMDLGYWSLLDLDERVWYLPTRGPFVGLATAPVPEDCLDFVRDRVKRDSVFEGARRAEEYNCLACGACCRQNRVELGRDDIERFESAERPELAAPPYTRNDGGLVVLRLTRDRRCKHLLSDNRCAIYAVRPDACSEFPAGSECCLSVRERLGLGPGRAARRASRSPARIDAIPR